MTILQDNKKYISLIIILLIIGGAVALIFPFLISIITSALAAYLFYPLYEKIYKKINKQRLSALLTTLIITLLILLPAIAIINGLAIQAKSAYTIIVDNVGNQEQLENLQALTKEKLGLDFDLGKVITDFASFITSFTKDFLTSLPNKIIQIFLFFFLFYYYLKEGPEIIKNLKELLPLSKDNSKKILKKVDELLKAIVFGSLLTALVQGAIGGIGFLIFGIDSPLFWGFVMAIFALIPMIGTAVVWLPASLILIITGYINSNAWMIGKGIGLAIYGALIISLVDNFLKPYLIGDKAKLHPAIVLIGILGGISLMGFVGIIIGPIIMALALSIIEIYKLEMKKQGR
ncbi:hypothetical protein C0585_08280 [Candidatus Woesearchaeota archaeon]|nr:MAG: hypothetical protein C0585_08280 [Candidatus Woesearchaeota archaeon]